LATKPPAIAPSASADHARPSASIAADVLGGKAQLPCITARDVVLLHDSDAYADPGSWRAIAALPRILNGIADLGHRTGLLG